MKKVKLIGKKVMSVGLAASLLLAPVGANNCCFAAWGKDSQAQKVKGENEFEHEAEATVAFVSMLFLVGITATYFYNNQGDYEKILGVISESAKGAWNFIGDKKEAITNFWTVYGDEITLEGKWIVENIKNIGYDIYFLIKLLCESAYNIGESAYYILDTIGFKNVLSAIGGLYVTNKLWNGTKWVYNKVSGLFKSKKNEQENKDNKGKLKQTENINVNNVNVNNLNVNNLDEDWFNNHRDKLKKALGM